MVFQTFCTQFGTAPLMYIYRCKQLSCSNPVVLHDHVHVELPFTNVYPAQYACMCSMDELSRMALW